MNYQNGSTRLIRKVSDTESDERLEQVSLRNVPLEVRKKDAEEPLFLIRYE